MKHSFGHINVKSGVLMIGNFLSWTFNQSVCEDLAARLSEAGWLVKTSSDRSRRLARVLDMTRTTLKQRRYYDVAVVEVFSGAAFMWAEAVCHLLRWLDKPYVLSLHGGNLPTFARKYPGRVRRLLNSSEVVTTPSRFLLEQMQPYCDDLILLPNPLDLSAYEFRPREMAAAKLIWLRAFHNIYNPSLAPKVLALLAPDFLDVHLTMVGPDKGDGSFQEAQRVARRLNLADKIKLPGGVNKERVSGWLQAGDIFLNTTNIDNTPISVIEAMACGLCIVSTNVGGIPYLLKHEEDALLVPPDDPEAMAAAVSRILRDPSLAQRLSHNARKKAQEFDWSIILPKWENLLLTISSQK